MVRTVYADLLFLINLSMDFLCFFLVARLFGRPLRFGRTLLASVLGGIYAVASLFLPFGGIAVSLLDAAVCAGMCAVAIGGRGTRLSKLFRETLVYIGVSMALGGIMTAVYTALNRTGIPEELSGSGDGPGAWLLLLLAVIGGGATMLGSRFFRKERAQCYIETEIVLFGERYRFRARVDTGNALADPISGAPAAVIDLSGAERLLRGLDPVDSSDPLRLSSAIPPVYKERIRLLPARTVSGETLLVAVRPDFCRIRAEGATFWEERKLLVAVSQSPLSDVEMLLPPGIL